MYKHRWWYADHHLLYTVKIVLSTLLLLLLLNSLHSIGEPHLYIGTVFNIWVRSTDVNYSGGYRA